ncbi:hypothetical protein B1729_16240 [Microbacterium sp. B35-04]|uniref:glycosyltransferase n=1 Tax=Microbacterium sp. B35-04 TaxID=1961716 RepID=UPI001EF9AD0F|nr:glycosyltransferase [Microbacterium sp. B35-04]KAF2412222.1 hypothetical protein B1729_16240 [Microbacterium sp. B35-04]
MARAVLPVSDTTEVLPLYLDGELDTVGFEILGRHSLRVDAGRTVSFGSYFNAFPASYWRAHTGVREVRLTVRTSGAGGVVRVMRSDPDARPMLVEERGITDVREELFALSLDGFDDGGCYWFDLVADDDGLLFDGADWTVAASRPAGTASVGMATFNRPADCLSQLDTIARDPTMLAVLDRIIVVDQGTDLVTAQAGFEDVARSLGDRLVLVRQANLGGSGGFSRAMAETLDRGESDYVLLLDDDAICEPEAIVRAVRFADYASAPTIVGGGMIHIDARTVLYAQSEQWDTRIGWVDLNRADAYDHDFARTPFRSTPFAHRLHRSDFNGWWMCLIPVEVLRAHGLSLPLFLKGDDVEFGLRAKAGGVATVSVPGIALWHLGWGGKAPTRTWEAYFLHRNRLIGELLHSPQRRPHLVVAHSFFGDLKPLLTLQYSAVRLRALAIRDVLDGPESLPRRLATRAGEVRALWAGFADATTVDPAAHAVGTGRVRAVPSGRAAQAVLLARLWMRQLLVPAAGSSRTRPDAHVKADELSWSTFTQIDSALVDTPDGAATVWYRRSRGATVRALGRSIRLHALLWWRWPALARRFRGAAAELSSPRQWAEIFAEHS